MPGVLIRYARDADLDGLRALEDNSFASDRLTRRSLQRLISRPSAAVRVAAREPGAIVVVEAAIMIEAGSYQRYDVIILAVCARETQIARAMKRDGLTREEVVARLERQMPLAEKIPYAQFVIDTDHAKEETIARTRDVYESLRALQRSKSIATAGPLSTL